MPIAVLIFLGKLDTQTIVTACVLQPTFNSLHIERIPTSQFFEDKVRALSYFLFVHQVKGEGRKNNHYCCGVTAVSLIVILREDDKEKKKEEKEVG
jgi:hypothetical protein